MHHFTDFEGSPEFWAGDQDQSGSLLRGIPDRPMLRVGPTSALARAFEDEYARERAAASRRLSDSQGP
jgi:hypothetical protein